MHVTRTFGVNLRMLRLRRGLSQIGLAQMLGHRSNSSVSYWERTAAIPKAPTIARLGDKLGYHPRTFLRGVETAYDRLRRYGTLSGVRWRRPRAAGGGAGSWPLVSRHRRR